MYLLFFVTALGDFLSATAGITTGIENIAKTVF